MDFRDGPEEARFRERAGAWLDQALADVPEQSGLGEPERRRWGRIWQQRLSDGGWVGLDWPEAFGGKGLSVLHQAIFNEEAARRNAPWPLNGQGTLLAGPTILAHGSEEQKARFCGPILRSEQYWCQGFSEPGAGSDLASLKTRARRVEGGWLIDGEKVWTSWAHEADRCMLLARTDADAPKHAGITYFLADMRDAEVRPLVMINGDAEFNQVFFDGVYVADEDVLGPVGGGWKVAMTTLAFERGGMALSLWVWAREAIDELIASARERGLEEDPEVLSEIGRLNARAEAVRIGSIRMMSDIGAGRTPGPETSALKLLWASAVQDASRAAVRLLGGAGLAPETPAAHAALDRYLRSRGHTIEGGTDEVQKSILAERVLALPRSR
jgi:alkylation response protein AidB-like acyl-CoA dehydrogenase